MSSYAKRGYGISAIFEKSTGAFVGYCGVVRAPDRDFDELTYVFHQKFWGKGYATEIGRAMLAHVFEISSLHSISATIDPNNQDSKKVAAKLGMVETPAVENTVNTGLVNALGPSHAASADCGIRCLPRGSYTDSF